MLNPHPLTNLGERYCPFRILRPLDIMAIGIVHRAFNDSSGSAQFHAQHADFTMNFPIYLIRIFYLEIEDQGR